MLNTELTGTNPLIGGSTSANSQGITKEELRGGLAFFVALLRAGAAKTPTTMDDFAVMIGGKQITADQTVDMVHAGLVKIGMGV